LVRRIRSAKPDFFAAVPYRESLQLRIQHGGDFQTFSDGVSILIENVIRHQRGTPTATADRATS